MTGPEVNQQQTTVAPGILAGRFGNAAAQGAGQENTYTVSGTRLQAGGNTYLAADGTEYDAQGQVKPKKKFNDNAAGTSLLGGQTSLNPGGTSLFGDDAGRNFTGDPFHMVFDVRNLNGQFGKKGLARAQRQLDQVIERVLKEQDWVEIYVGGNKHADVVRQALVKRLQELQTTEAGQKFIRSRGLNDEQAQRLLTGLSVNGEKFSHRQVRNWHWHGEAVTPPPGGTTPP